MRTRQLVAADVTNSPVMPGPLFLALFIEWQQTPATPNYCRPGHVFLLSIDGFVRTTADLLHAKAPAVFFLGIEEGGRFKGGRHSESLILKTEALSQTFERMLK